MVRLRAHDIRQIVKWVVYTLLTINFVFYFLEELEFAEYTLRESSGFLEWTAAFATTIDEIAWLVLIALFELETYALSDEAFKGITGRLIRGGRIVCYVLIAHAVYAWATAVIDIEDSTFADVSDVCQLVAADVSFTRNLDYTRVDATNCGEFSNERELFYIEDGAVVTDFSGLIVARQLAWVDLIEAIVWLLILMTIEVTVRLQGRDVTAGSIITMCNLVKLAFYSMLVLAMIYWAYRGHWLYVWDEFVWIAGFAAIEMNISEWRDEIRGVENASF